MKITKKVIGAYYRANREGLSANESYNTDVFGIDTPTYKLLKQAHDECFGICGGDLRMTLKQAKESNAVRGI
jgi:hypothetical protein